MLRTNKTNRIDLRIDDNTKALIEQAAAINNLSVSSYINSVCKKQAIADINQNSLIQLDKEEWETINEMLENPAEQNKELMKMFEAWK